MKSVIIFALLATVALSAVVPDVSNKLHVHLHIDQPIKTNRIDGIVRNLIHNAINKPEVEYHLHLDELVAEDEEFETEFTIEDEALEDFNIGGAIKKGVNVLKNGIQGAINKAKGAFNKIKHEIAKIHLPAVKLPKILTPVIQIAKIVSKLVPCAMTIKNAIPSLVSFAKAVAANKAADAVEQLMNVLKYMPDISSKCLNKPFNIPSKVMNKIQCAADIVALAAVVGEFIVNPVNVINTINGIRSLIDLIPKAVSDCTGAFK